MLVDIATIVDIVEPITKFCAHLKYKPFIGNIFPVGLESWNLDQSAVAYDLIWNQWCLGHLTDEQLVEYLKKCGRVLNEGGHVIVKENMSTGDEDIFDELDSSVTRYV
jgi:protein N-terminal methyltransferase